MHCATSTFAAIIVLHLSTRQLQAFDPCGHSSSLLRAAHHRLDCRGFCFVELRSRSFGAMAKHAKRKYTAATDESELDEITIAHRTKRARNIRVLSSVCIWRALPTTTVLDQRIPATPSAKRVVRKKGTPQQSLAKLLHERRVGPPIQLSPEKIAKIPSGYTSPPHEDVHLQHIGGLFFRLAASF